MARLPRLAIVKMQESSRELFVRFSLMVVFSALSFYGLKKVAEVMDPFHAKKQRSKEEVIDNVNNLIELSLIFILYDLGTKNPTFLGN